MEAGRGEWTGGRPVLAHPWSRGIQALDWHVEAQLPFNWLMVASLLLGLMGLPAGDQTVLGG